MTRQITQSPARWLGVAATATGILILAAGCSSSSQETTAASSPAATQSQEAPSDMAQDLGEMVSGEIVSIDGSIAQVQDSSSQTALTWDDETSVQVTKEASVSDVTVGSCVMVRGAGQQDGDSDQQSSDDQSTATSTSVTAASITIMQASDEGCEMTGGFGFGGAGGAGGGQGGTPPEQGADGQTPPQAGSSDQGTPPQGADQQDGDGQMAGPGGGQGGGFGQFVVGEVTAVSDSEITVESSMPSAPPAGQDSDESQDDQSATDDQTTTDSDQTESQEQLVVLSADTTYSKTVSGDSGDVETGLCVQASGESDSSGTLTATTMTLSQPGDEGCQSGMMGGNRGQEDA